MSVNYDSLKFLRRPQFLRERKVMLISDCPYEQEIKKGQAYSSQSAANLFRAFEVAGLSRMQIHATYLFNFRPEKSDIAALFYQVGMPLSEYTTWPQSKRDSILNFAYTELVTLREEIEAVKPDFIICTGRWGLYFLSGETSFADTKKSPFGTMLKWRASTLKLGSFWNYEKPHILMPILHTSNIFQVPEKAMVIQQDYARAGLVGNAAIADNISEYLEHPKNFIVRPSYQQVIDWLTEELLELDPLKGRKKYAIDVETRGGYHDCIGIAFSESDAICIPFSTLTSPNYWSEIEEIQIVRLLRRFLSHPKVYHIGQNYWYDAQYIWRDLVVRVKPDADTMVLQHTMFPGMEKKLNFLSSLYAKVYKYWKDEGKTAMGKTDEDRWYYNCKDCAYTFEVEVALQAALKACPPNIQKAYDTQLNKTLPALTKLMDRGVRINTARKESLRQEFSVLLADLRNELNYIIGEEFKPTSPDQKKTLLYDLFELPVQYDPKSRKPTTGAEALEILKLHNPLVRPIIDRISELGNINTLVSTFLNAKADIDGRIRCSYNLCGTDTFRFSSSKNVFDTGLNLQNIPKENTTVTGRVLPNIRELFIPDPGYTFFDIDLDSADLRIVTKESGARKLDEMFAAGLKPYVEAMKEYYHDPSKNKYSKEYTQFKSVIHALDYLGGAKGIAERVGLLVHEVERISRWWFGMNPEIAKHHEELRKQVFGRGYIENIFGYRKYILNKNEPTIMQIAAAWGPQSTVALIINTGMYNIDQQEKDILTLLQVHDSLAGQFPTYMEDAPARIKKACEIALPYETPLVIPVDIKTSEISWGHCD